jgi:hypothetical protein
MINHTTPTETENSVAHREKGSLLLKSLLWGFVFGMLLSVVLTLELFPVRRIELEVGQVSQTDIRAPRKVTYVSQVLTDKARSQAEQAVRDVYDPPDPRIGRQQAARLREILGFIDSTRHDSFAPADDKIKALMSIAEIKLAEDVARLAVEMSESNWAIVAAEAESVLDTIMREPIRSIDVNELRTRISSLVRLTLSENQTRVVTALVQNLIKVNSLYNARDTQLARQQARDSVDPVTMTVEQGQAILRQGDLVEPLDLEILEALGLLRPQIKWQDVIGNVLLAFLLTVLLGIYLVAKNRPLWEKGKYLALLSGSFLAFAVVARIMVPDHTVLPYLFPAAAFGLLVGTLFDIHLALFTSFLLGILVGAMGGGSLELAAYAFVGSTAAIFSVQRVERLNVFIFAGMVATVANWATILAFRLPGQQYDWIGLATLFGAGLLNGGVSAMVALLGYSTLGNLLDIPTTLRLMDLARPTHPMMRQLLLKAPGSYHHSLLVSNLAEEAAERVGADPLLARVGAYYHDIGKTVRPYFFVDNQTDGENVHDRLDAETSAHIIVSHVKDGVDLARKYDLPDRIVDFITEHHGTTLTNYFYKRAQDAAGEGKPAPDPERFRYPGPKPRSKETAIVMLADACEATVRSARPAKAEETAELVRRIIAERLESGQLNESDLTLRDIEKIQKAFTATLQGVFHPRVRYPGQEQKGTEKDGD